MIVQERLSPDGLRLPKNRLLTPTGVVEEKITRFDRFFY